MLAVNIHLDFRIRFASVFHFTSSNRCEKNRIRWQPNAWSGFNSIRSLWHCIALHLVKTISLLLMLPFLLWESFSQYFLQSYVCNSMRCNEPYIIFYDILGVHYYCVFIFPVDVIPFGEYNWLHKILNTRTFYFSLSLSLIFVLLFWF